MLAQVAMFLMGMALGQGSGLPHCDGRHAKLYTAEPIHNKPITSPSYPSAHGYTGNCLWLIERSFFNDDNYILKVVFNDFDLEDGSSYPCIGADALTFYDGPSPKSPSLGKYCGRSHPDVIYSTGQYLFVNFHGFIFKHRGFSFNVSAVKKEEASAICRLPKSEVRSLNGTSGTFFSPHFPASYPYGALCVWTITVPADKIVKVVFEVFSITVVSSSCSFVEIRDSLSSNGTELARSSCKDKTAYIPPVVYSTGRYMRVKFESKTYMYGYRRGENDRGFKVHFEAVDRPVDKELCLPGNVYNNFLSITAEKGFLMSPMKYYPPNLNCTWFITVPEGSNVYLMITRFNLDPICGDSIEFLDGPPLHPNERLATLCGSSSVPDVVRSRSRYMTVKFMSDAEYNGRYEGFEFKFKAVPEERDDLPNNSLAPWKIAIITLVLGLLFTIFCVVCYVKYKKRANLYRATNEASIPTASGDTRAPPPPPPEYPYPTYSPPPYPAAEDKGKETPQYPPPGESYPWLKQNAPAQPSL